MDCETILSQQNDEKTMTDLTDQNNNWRKIFVWSDSRIIATALEKVINALLHPCFSAIIITNGHSGIKKELIRSFEEDPPPHVLHWFSGNNMPEIVLKQLTYLRTQCYLQGGFLVFLPCHEQEIALQESCIFFQNPPLIRYSAIDGHDSFTSPIRFSDLIKKFSRLGEYHNSAWRVLQDKSLCNWFKTDMQSASQLIAEKDTEAATKMIKKYQTEAVKILWHMMVAHSINEHVLELKESFLRVELKSLADCKRALDLLEELVFATNCGETYA